MSNGFGPYDGTVTFPGFLWVDAPDDVPDVESWIDGAMVRPTVRADLVLRVERQGWGAYAGITVIDPKTGESVDIPEHEQMVVGRLEHDPDPDLPGSRQTTIIVDADDLRRFRRTKEERVNAARDLVMEAERRVEQARETLARVEQGDVTAV